MRDENTCFPGTNHVFYFHFSALFQEIKGRQQDFMKAFNAGDAAGAASVYDPDGYFMPNGRNPVKGRSGMWFQNKGAGEQLIGLIIQLKHVKDHCDVRMNQLNYFQASRPTSRRIWPTEFRLLK